MVLRLAAAFCRGKNPLNFVDNILVMGGPQVLPSSQLQIF